MEHLEMSYSSESQGSQMFLIRSSPGVSSHHCGGDVFLWKVSPRALWNPQHHGIIVLWTSSCPHPPSLHQPQLILFGDACASFVSFSHLGQVLTKWFSSPLKWLNVTINMKSSTYQIITRYAFMICHRMISGSFGTSTGNWWKIHIIIIWASFTYKRVVYHCEVYENR